MASYEYLSSGDFNNLVSKNFAMSGYVTYSNDMIESLAYSHGITPTGIYQTPLNPMVKRYGMECGYCELYLDKFGTNNTNSPEQDKYLVLYDKHNEILQKLRRDITVEMITGDATTSNSNSTTSLLYRG